MREIPMSSRMVAGILAGNQKKFRRAVRPRLRKGEKGVAVYERNGRKVVMIINQNNDPVRPASPPFKAGMILGIQESYAHLGVKGKWDKYVYKATDTYPFGFRKFKNFHWSPPAKMPLAAMRLFLKVKDVQIGRISDMEPLDYEEEGYAPETLGGIDKSIDQYRHDWNLTFTPGDREVYGFDKDPWCWIYTVEQVSPEEAKGE